MNIHSLGPRAPGPGPQHTFHNEMHLDPRDFGRVEGSSADGLVARAQAIEAIFLPVKEAPGARSQANALRDYLRDLLPPDGRTTLPPVLHLDLSRQGIIGEGISEDEEGGPFSSDV